MLIEKQLQDRYIIVQYIEDFGVGIWIIWLR